MSHETLNSNTHSGCEMGQGRKTSKRSEVRQRVLLRAQLHLVLDQGGIQVNDLSRSGLRGMTDVKLHLGETVFVSLDDITHCSGMVRWVDERRFGMKFSKNLDMLPCNSAVDLGKSPDHQERMPRFTTNLTAKIRLCASPHGARIRNVSKSGMMVETDMPLACDQQLVVSLSNGRLLTADVKWVEGDRVGVLLASPVSILQFTYGDLQ